MLSRRRFIGTGIAALAAGLASRRGMAAPAPTAFAPPGTLDSSPLASIGPLREPLIIDGLPFAPDKWTGDTWGYADMPFHHGETDYPGGKPPAPSEESDIVIVGGGLSGLATAHLLAHRRPVIFEMADRFGGVSRGETWNGLPYSMGSAYFINPDPGSVLERFYRSLGLGDSFRLSEGADPVEFNGALIDDLATDPRVPPEERQAIARYRAIVLAVLENEYPEIPLVGDKADYDWILKLDLRSFKEDVEARMGGPVPPLLASLIQGYFYSSFNAGWEEISAAAGWNFVAAEELGRWILPGGNAGLAEVLYRRVARAARSSTPSGRRSDAAPSPGLLRAGRRVVQVLPADRGRILVVSSDGRGRFESTLARRVVLACPKHVARHILSPLLSDEHPWMQAARQVTTHAYVVVNLLLDRPLGRDFYDMFLLYDGRYPTDTPAFEAWHRITDVVSGVFNAVHHDQRSVLTCYWPLSYPASRFPLFDATSYDDYARRAAPRIRHLLSTLGLPEAALVQARMTRWGHAFPNARIGFLAGGAWRVLQEEAYPGIFAVGQDNWVLPAVETCLLDAIAMAPRIEKGL